MGWAKNTKSSIYPKKKIKTITVLGNSLAFYFCTSEGPDFNKRTGDRAVFLMQLAFELDQRIVET